MTMPHVALRSRKFCADRSEAVSQTPKQRHVSIQGAKTPTCRHDCTLESIAPTDVDESFAVGGVGDMPPIGAPSFRT